MTALGGFAVSLPRQPQPPYSRWSRWATRGATALGACAVAACADRAPTAPTRPAATVSAAVTAAAPALTWLAPLGAGAADPATFDAAAAPVVEVCAWGNGGCVGPAIVRFSTAPTGPDLALTVNAAAGRYEASWNLADARFTTRRTYRVRVLQGAAELGALSVDVVRGRWALTRTDGTLAPLTSAAALPVRFHLARAGAPVTPIIPATTKVLDSTALAHVRAVDTNTIVFTPGAPIVARLEVGDIVAAGVSPNTPYGLLRRVLAIQSSGGVVRVRTGYATVADAIERGEFHFVNVPLTRRRAAANRAAVAPAATVSATFETSTPDIPLGPHTHVTAGYSGELSLSGDFRVEDHDLKELSFVVGTKDEVSLEGSITAEADGSKSLELATWEDVDPITVFVGPLPIVLWPTVNLELSGSWAVKGGMSVTRKMSLTRRAGFYYADESLRPVWGFEPEFSREPFAPTVEGSLELALGPHVSVTPYLPATVLRLLGIHASVGLGLEAFVKPEAHVLTDPWWELFAGAKGVANVDLKFWGRGGELDGELGSLQIRLLKGESELAVTPESPSVDVGATTDLAARVRSKDALHLPLPLIAGRRDVKWASRNASVATVAPSSAGGGTATVTGRQPGQVWIVAHTTHEAEASEPADTLEAADSVSLTVKPCTANCPGEPPPPDPVAGNTGTSHDDPHLRTVDGKYYDFHAVGDYVLSKSTAAGDDFEVQARYRRLNDGVSINDAVAARVAGDLVNVYPAASGFDLVLNDEIINGTRALVRGLPHGGAVRVDGGAVTISWPDRTVLTVLGGGSELLLPYARKGKVEGLLGNYDGDPKNDVRLRGGRPLADSVGGLYRDFRASWRVPYGSAASLFRRGPDLWDPDFPRSVVTLADLDPAKVSAARATCRGAGVVDPHVLDTCAFDIAVTGDTKWAAVSVRFDPAVPSLTVAPGAAYLTAGTTRAFTAAVEGLTSKTVSWTATGGTVATTGANSMTYTAPSAPGEYTITATAAQNPGVRATARVVVLAAGPTGTASGRVYAGATGAAVPNATLRFTQASGLTLPTVRAGGDGTWRAGAVPPGVYTVRIDAPGYRSTTVRALRVDGDVTVPAIPLTATGVSGGAAQLTIRDAATGQPLAVPVTLTVVDGIALTSAAVDTLGGRTVAVPAGGVGTVASLANTVTIRARAAGYADALTYVAPEAGRTVPVSVALVSSVGAAGTVKIVLTWGAEPRDLDSYLLGPTGDGGQFLVYYASRGSCASNPFACLDVDDTDGFGPETITISRQFPGTYTYSVNRYSGIGTIATSGARVDVYVDGRLAQTFTPPPTSQADWTVFQLSGGRITPAPAAASVAPFALARRAPKTAAP